MNITLTPAQNGFVKQLFMIVILAVTGYLANVANLSPALGVGTAAVVSALASSLESYIRSETGNGLFGAVGVD